jgi:alpha-beta hydrolase superfamily lysophospholipase
LPSKSWRHTEGRFNGEHGTEIYYQSWTPTGKPKAILLLAHGIGEHSGRYTHVADYFARMGYAFWACDHRGHGKSGGKRGHVNSFDEYLADLHRLIGIARESTPALKTFLIGHSLGGPIAPRYAQKYPGELAGLILSGPAFRDKVASPAKILLAKAISPIIPTFTAKTGLDPSLISRDREVVRKYVEDPMVHGVATARWYTEYRRAQDEAMQVASKLVLPTLILQGGADGIVDASATSEFFRKLASPDKTLRVYEGFYHEVLNEPGKESVLRDMDAWLTARI